MRLTAGLRQPLRSLLQSGSSWPQGHGQSTPLRALPQEPFKRRHADKKVLSGTGPRGMGSRPSKGLRTSPPSLQFLPILPRACSGGEEIGPRMLGVSCPQGGSGGHRPHRLGGERDLSHHWDWRSPSRFRPPPSLGAQKWKRRRRLVRRAGGQAGLLHFTRIQLSASF